MAESDNILMKLQDLLLYLIPQLNKFPRDQKFVLGDRIETKLLNVQEDCLRAYYSRDKRGHLLEANLPLEVTRHLVRLANALKLFRNNNANHARCANRNNNNPNNANNNIGFRCVRGIREGAGGNPCPLRAGGMRKITDFRSVPNESPPDAARFPPVIPGNE
jgi:hypothetical protein